MRENPFNVIFKKKEFLFPFDYPLAPFPYYVDVELTNKCNLRCTMCSRQVMKRETGFMKTDTFVKIVEEIKNYDSAVRFVRWGEPTLHPHFDAMIACAKAYDILVYVSTNAYTSPKSMLALYKANPDVIRFSFQGTNRETFEKFRTPANYILVATAVKHLSDIRKVDRKELPYMIIGTSLTDETEKEKKEFEDYWLQYVDAVEFSKTSFSRLGGGVGEYKPCTEVLTKLSVDWDGTITACCADYDKFLSLGNINYVTLKEVWDSPQLNSLRAMVGEELRHGEVPFCKDCYVETSKFDKLKEITNG